MQTKSIVNTVINKWNRIESSGEEEQDVIQLRLENSLKKINRKGSNHVR